jgi:hypothetical protein
VSYCTLFTGVRGRAFSEVPQSPGSRPLKQEMQYVRLDVVQYVAKSPAASVCAAYSRGKAGQYLPSESAPGLTYIGRARLLLPPPGAAFALPRCQSVLNDAPSAPPSVPSAPPFCPGGRPYGRDGHPPFACTLLRSPGDPLRAGPPGSSPTGSSLAGPFAFASTVPFASAAAGSLEVPPAASASTHANFLLR